MNATKNSSAPYMETSLPKATETSTVWTFKQQVGVSEHAFTNIHTDRWQYRLHMQQARWQVHASCNVASLYEY